MSQFIILFVNRLQLREDSDSREILYLDVLCSLIRKSIQSETFLEAGSDGHDQNLKV